MGKLKIAELVLLAVSAFVSVVKYGIKCIDYIIRIKNRPARSTP